VAGVQREVRSQLEQFRELLGRDPDHIDSHQHAHRNEPVLSIARQIARELSVPLRHCSSIQYCGQFYGQDEHGDSYPQLIGVEALCALIRLLPPGPSEICCHPAADEDLDTMYLSERRIELASLCDRQVCNALLESGIKLLAFGDLPR
jgi:predicted glycoside hydrolase/deacetylase ChbG (UPF0249 family)